MWEIAVALGVYVVWGLFDFLNISLVFKRFIQIDKPTRKDYNYLWLIYYVLITVLYCLSIYRFQEIYVLILFFPYYFRAVPLVWSKYGINKKIPFTIFLYEEIAATVSSNINILIKFIFGKDFNYKLVDDICVTFVVIAFYMVFITLKHMGRTRKLNIWFANLSIKEYVVMMIAMFSLGNLEALICLDGEFIPSLYSLLIIVGIICLIVMICNSIFVSERSKLLENNMDTLREHVEKLTEAYAEIDEKNVQLRRFRHDIKNLMMALKAMIEQKKNDQALEYIGKVWDDFQKTGREFDTGNFVADALLSVKANSAEKIGAKLTFEGFIPSTQVNDVDMVVLLTNLIDNAIEACSKQEGSKEIIVESTLSKYMWVLTVKNPIAVEVDIVDNRIGTSKENKDIHGYGILNVERVAEKYGGMLKLKCEEKEFIARATLKFE